MADNLSLGNKTGIAFTVLMIIGFLPLSTLGGGAVQKSNGTTSCTMPTGAFSCTISGVYSPSFPSTPQTPSFTFRTGTTAVNLPRKTVPFFALESLGQTWTNMPAAKTEIFGDTTHEITNDLTLGLTAIFFVMVAIASASPGAVLRPEYSVDGGVTWTDLAANAGFLDVPVDGTGFCLNSAGSCSNGGNDITIATAARTKSVGLRIVGLNGGGLGDSPAFVSAMLIIFSQTTSHYQVWVVSNTKTSFNANIVLNFGTQLTSNLVTVDWKTEQ